MFHSPLFVVRVVLRRTSRSAKSPQCLLRQNGYRREPAKRGGKDVHVVEGKRLFHNGAWGLATLEAGLAVTDSGRERREIMMKHQVEVPADYDTDFPVPYLDGK